MSSFNRRTFLATGLGLAGVGVLSACIPDPSTNTGEPDANGVTTLIVGASPMPHARILEFVRDNLAEAAKLTIDIREYTDYILPNKDLKTGDVNVNFYQTVPFLKTEVETNGYEFTAGKGVHVEPLGFYSKKFDSVESIPTGAQIAIPNDPTNRGRALVLLADAGLITLEDGVEATGASINQISSNPKNLNFKEMDGAMIPRSLSDFAGAVINGNFAIEAELSPAKDAIYLEKGKGNPNANILVWRSEDDAKPAIKKLEELLHSAEVKQFIEETYKDGSVIPAF